MPLSRFSVLSLAVCLTLLAAGPGLAQPQSPQPPSDPANLPAATPIGSGPYRAVMEADPGLPTHTLYHPGDLGAAGGKLPVVVWGNGACANAGNSFRWFLSEIASYGYVVVAIGPIAPNRAGTGGGSYAPITPIGPNNPMPPPPPGPPASRSAQLIDGLNWILAENDRPASKYFHHLDTKKIALMGQSCGGVQAIEASADPRVTTTMIWNSGLLPGVTTMAGGKDLTKDDLKLLHAPIAYISGDDEDIAYLNANDDFARLKGLVAFRGYERGVLHTATYRERDGGEFGGVAVAWLNWRLKGDAKSGRMFQGKDCGLCVNPRWVVAKKGIP